jgi:hypothetical protein
MIPGKYDIPAHYNGDTLDAQNYVLSNLINEVSTPINLTGATIKWQFKEGSRGGAVVKELNIGTGITVTDAANGDFTMDAFRWTYGSGVFYYDVQFTFPDGSVKTYITGRLNVIEDTTS